jgi:subtilisin-like proprotein convertase family protein
MRLLSSGSTLALTATAALVAATSHAQVFSNPAPMPIGDAGTIGVAAPYPATITVSGFTGTITDLDVRIAGLFHTFPDDVDVMLVGPTGAAVVFWSDAGGSADAVGVALEFDDEGAAGIPDGGPIVTGTFLPSVFVAGDVFPAPAPAPPAGSALSVFDGTDPNGVWSLYVVDDLGADVGAIQGGWALDITTSTTAETTVPSPASIRIHDRWGTGTPNPSQIVVSGAPPQLTSITVTLNGLSHLNPDDLDIVLVGPTGANFVFWSDAGGTVDVTNASVTLDDAGATVLPDATIIATGTFQPRNYGTGDTPIVPPLPPYNDAATAGTATFTSVFANTDPNGTWSLYISDDATGSTGTVAGGWSISIVASPVELMDFKVE